MAFFKKNDRNASRRSSWKTAAQYTLGILVLALSVAFAWFLPGWYSQWSDEQLAGRVTLENREELRFLDTDSLDLAGRMKMLSGTSQNISWLVDDLPSLNFYPEDDTRYPENEMFLSGVLSGQKIETILERFNRMLEQWREAGLLPLPERLELTWESFYAASAAELASVNIYLESEEGFRTLPVYLVFMKYPRLLALFDQERDVIYYMSLVGNTDIRVGNGIANYLGYDSYLEMQNLYFSGELSEDELRDRSDSDFAAVCGALSAEIASNAAATAAGELSSVTLQYETFEAPAFRRFIATEEGCGLAVMFGTESWLDVVQDILTVNSEYEYEVRSELAEWIINPGLAEMQATGQMDSTDDAWAEAEKTDEWW